MIVKHVLMNMDIELEKQQIRAWMRQKLKAQSEADRYQKSREVAQKLKKDASFQDAKAIMFYISTEEEVETKGLLSDILKIGKKIAVPYMDKNSSEIKPSFIQSIDADLAKGNYGILEPKNEKIEAVSLGELDLVLVPGIAFDQANNRLGRGKGYYDRFLAKLPRKVKTFGLAFDFQLVHELPVTELDVPLTRVFHN